MSKDNGTFFNMKMTKTQKEILDFVTEVIYDDSKSKAGVINDLIKQQAINYVFGIGSEDFNLSDDALLALIKQEKRNRDIQTIRTIGIDKIKIMVEQKVEGYEYFEELIKHMEENGQDKVDIEVTQSALF
ncbi:hypothetical protein ADU78_10390 [Clostridium botulinum]|uniref:hypothetical protein n=1 Tax=Clostridium botulinum TaxID=1491 RepID=UPI00069953B6|nr:hypothetical protein [Clostridium botulinum]KOA74567.1 hypothetical protein ADU78_10390 [Clostridium botulinum]